MERRRPACIMGRGRLDRIAPLLRGLFAEEAIVKINSALQSQ
jgi:hypothetical protein